MQAKRPRVYVSKTIMEEERLHSIRIVESPVIPQVRF
jgi:hypothetical protein